METKPLKQKITVQDVKALMLQFEKVRNFFLKRNNLHYKRIVPKQNVQDAKLFNDFFKILYFIRQIQEVEDIDVYKFFYAQFFIAKKEVYPKMLYSDWAINNYYSFLKQEKKKQKNPGNKIVENDIVDVISKSRNVLIEFMKRKKIHFNVWEEKIHYKGCQMSLMWYLFLTRKISPYFLVFTDKYKKELYCMIDNDIISKKTFDELSIARMKIVQ